MDDVAERFGSEFGDAHLAPVRVRVEVHPLVSLRETPMRATST